MGTKNIMAESDRVPTGCADGAQRLHGANMARGRLTLMIAPSDGYGRVETLLARRSPWPADGR